VDSTRADQLLKEEQLLIQTQLSKFLLPISIIPSETATISHSKIKELMEIKMSQNSKISEIKAIFRILICTENLIIFTGQKRMMLITIMKAALFIMEPILEIALHRAKLPVGM
jgi:hypothetical protein